MSYIDKLIEATADWFMDLFLDPVYVVETSNGRVEAILVPDSAITFAPEITVIEPEVNLSSGIEEEALAALPQLNSVAITVLMQVKGITAAVTNFFEPKLEGENVINILMQHFSLPIYFSKYLTG